jgi:RNA-directed DNA polymerase
MKLDSGIVAIDPDIFVNWTCSQNKIKTVLQIYESLFTKSKERTEVKFLINAHLEKCYQDIQANSNHPDELSVKIIKEILYSSERPLSESGSLPNNPIADKIEISDTSENLNETKKVLIQLASDFPELIVILADPDVGETGDQCKNLRDHVCRSLRREAIIYSSDFTRTEPFIMTEGKTDWKHLKAALKKLKSSGLFLGLHLKFNESDVDLNSSKLLHVCRTGSRIADNRITICIFDRDEKSIVKEISDTSNIPGEYKYWKNNVYSFPLPVPKHRKDVESFICIELYYQDSEIKTIDNNGRRLFLSAEFHNDSGRHLDEDLSCSDKNKFSRQCCIIDDKVYNSRNQNMALPKAKFAEYVLNEVEKFNNFGFLVFSEIFRIISHILGLVGSK